MMAPAVLASVRALFVEDEITWALNIYGTGIGIAVSVTRPRARRDHQASAAGTVRAEQPERRIIS